MQWYHMPVRYMILFAKIQLYNVPGTCNFCKLGVIILIQYKGNKFK